MEGASTLLRRVSSILDTRTDGTLRLPALICSIVVVGSLVGTLVELSESTKYHMNYGPLNQYFVKLGWMWTVVPLLLCEITHTLSTGKLRVAQLSNLLCATALWFLFTSSFEYINEITGTCSVADLHSARACSRGRGVWNGFDISGHVYLMTLSSMCFWEQSPSLASFSGTFTEVLHSSRNPLVLVLDILARSLVAVIRIIWLVMLTSTSLFFHTVLSKYTALLFAIASWWAVYAYARKRIFIKVEDVVYLW